MSYGFLTDDEARALYTEGDAAHDFDHVERVTRLALRIAQTEGADAVVVRLAALLHDVPVHDSGRADRQQHHLAAAAFAEELLRKRGLPEEQARNVGHCIQAHRFRDQSVQPQTLEARCLYDADKLDSIGAIGVCRAFAFAGAHGGRLWVAAPDEITAESAPPTGADYTPVHEFVYKLRRILTTLYTPTAQALGVRRHAFMTDFFAQLEDEMSSRC